MPSETELERLTKALNRAVVRELERAVLMGRGHDSDCSPEYHPDVKAVRSILREIHSIVQPHREVSR